MLHIFSKAYLNHYKQTFVLAYPIIISNLGQVMVGVVDVAMVGKIGYKEQAAVSLANGFFNIIMLFGIGITVGSTPLVAAADSKNNISEKGLLLKHSLILNTVTGILLFLALLAISPFMRYIGQNEEVVKLAIPFLNVMMLGMVPLCIFNTFKQFTEALSYTRTAMIISISGNIINIILNYFLIFGISFFPKMGLMGSCWATFISRCFMALGMFIYVYYTPVFKIYWSYFTLKNFSFLVFRKILSIGLPLGFQHIFEVGAFASAMIIAGWISPVAQASHQIALSISTVTYMFVGGIANAATVRVGNNFGLKNELGIKLAGTSAVIITLTLMSIACLIFLNFNYQLASIFSNDPMVINTAASLLIISAFFQLSDGLQVTSLGVLRGMQDVKLPTAITLVAYWVVGLPMCYFLAIPCNFGIKGIWYGLLIALSFAGLLLFFRFLMLHNKMQRMLK